MKSEQLFRFIMKELGRAEKLVLELETRNKEYEGMLLKINGRVI